MLHALQVQKAEDQATVTPNTDRSDIRNIEAGNLSNSAAEKRADAGPDQPFSSIQAFDGVGEFCLWDLLIFYICIVGWLSITLL